MKILLIEDDLKTANYVMTGLREYGHVVDHAGSGREGLFLAGEPGYAVLIVDRMLPGMDGLVLVRVLRQSGVETPALFLTALDDTGERVRGLEAGGDDYLVKPFAFAELLARLNALARRPPLCELPAVLRVGELEMDLRSRRLTRSGERIDLQPREFQLLEYLMRNAGAVVTRTMLLENVWDMHFDPSTNIVETHMSRLRAKLRRAQMPDPIQTVRGFGYVLGAVA